ncbi:hypothetical protein EMCRGX_G008114 [Ephydatia muelleri]
MVCTAGDIRLVGNGSTISQGRVEVCYNNTWGTVCDSSWDIRDATVACKQLGFSGAVSEYSRGYFGQGMGEIFLGSLQCNGPETSLLKCSRFSSIGNTGCSHSQDAGVNCSTAYIPGCTTGDVRLVGSGSTINQGRVEVCYNNTWGTVCDYGWGTNDAAVVCKQLGYYGPPTSYTGAYFGQGTGIILFSDLNCNGIESSLFSCPYSGSIGHTTCTHSRDAGVNCSQLDGCITGDVRLVGNGSTISQGRVEVCYNNTWGTVCDDSFDSLDASVVCKQLGYYGTSQAYGNASFGQGVGTILLRGLLCNGREASLLACSQSYSIGSTGCNHSRDAGVNCSLSASCGTTGSVRLVGTGSSVSQGRVEICYNHQWGTVCDSTWDINAAIVVCRQLGYNGTAYAIRGAKYGQGTGAVLLGGVVCSGSELTPFECSRSQGIGSTNCLHSSDAGVNCSIDTTPACSTGAIRLAGQGSNSSQGRVEICYNGQWGTVCDYLWDTNEAAIVCKQLGYNGPSIPFTGAYFGQGTGLILFGGLTCSGTEASLFECSIYYSIDSVRCFHYWDAGVSCSDAQVFNCSNGDVRLVGSRSSMVQGTVEVCYNQHWGTVCDYLWDANEASIVCKQLGFNGTSTAYAGAFFGQSTDQSFLNGLLCSGSEQTLLECGRYSSIYATGCGSTRNAGVTCSIACTPGNVRLVGRLSSANQGTVELCVGGTWGTVCDDSWSLNEAIVVCNQLGYQGTTVAHISAYFGQSNETTLLSGVACTVCHSGDVRLVGRGSTISQGRVEVCYNNTWGTVCDDSWDINEAIVVCNQLGYYDGTAVPYRNAYFGQGLGVILLNGLECNDTESSLLLCPYTNTVIGDTNCYHSQDVGVNCSQGCTTGDVRLVGSGSTISQGRVEVCYNNTWGTVCSDSWDLNDAIVVCKQLGYYGTSYVYTNGYFGLGTGPIMLTGLGCTSSEASVISCPHTSSVLGTTGCNHSADAGVSCTSVCRTGDVRLVGNGSTISQGRVEVCYNNTWGTVCGDSWDINEAIVVCNQLGYYGTASSCCSPNPSQGTGVSILSGLNCSGTELSLLSCPRNPIIRPMYCNGAQDAFVACSSVCNTGDVRLVGSGSTISQGRVEVCYNNTWGTVCDDSWDINEAIVVCNQIGYNGESAALSGSYFGEGVGRILLSELRCESTETSLISCLPIMNTVGSTNCSHSSDSGVSCSSACFTGDVRLVGRESTISQGRVEVCYNNTWETVCGDTWDLNDAIVVCKQLGYNGTSYVYTNGYFGLGTGPIMLTGLGCTSSEASVISCPHTSSVLGTTGCNHSADAGVSCTSVCRTGDLRLVGNGSTISQGRVEVCYNNTWGTVCGDSWDLNDAIVVCNQLGYHGTASSCCSPNPSQGMGVSILSGLDCSGTELSLLSCPHNPITRPMFCNGAQEAFVTCSSVCNTGDVRLVGSGSTISQGRVEVCYNNTWGTVCDDSWDINEAIVVCNQIGYNGESAALSGSYFGEGVGRILLSELRCESTETSLLSCLPIMNTVGSTNCSHSSDSGVSCSSACFTGDVRLVGRESTISQGRVEVCYNNTWETVCGDTWDLNDAIVVCKQLGYYGTSYVYTNGYFGLGTGPIMLTGLGCTSSEASVISCPHTSSTTGCNHSADAGVSCTSVCRTGDLRLVGNGSTISQGRVEVCYNNTWGTVCGESWDLNDAIVVCNQLGYHGTASSCCSPNPSQGMGVSILSGLNCNGTELSLLSCPHNPITHPMFCNGAQEAFVTCSSVCNTGDVRLVGSGSTISQGRVEVCYNNTWGTVCDDSWDINEAIVVCNQIGYFGESAALSGSYFGEGVGRILLSELRCESTETSLLSCLPIMNTVGSTNCSHSSDSGVSCSSACFTGDVRLVGRESTISQGRVEVCYNNTWETVCGDTWDLNDAIVVSKQLGYYGTSYVYTNGYFGLGTGPIMLTGLGCTSSEASVISCPHTSSVLGTTGCNHSADAGVSCTSVCHTGDLRLVGNGSTISQGRVEVCYNNTWGTVCGDSWDLNDAIVVCNQLGYHGTASSCCSPNPSQGTGVSILSGLNCSGTELSLLSCPRNPIIRPMYCNGAQDAFVACSSVCNSGDVRLVGRGSTISQGRVEVCYNNTWGTVCDDSWDINEAIVVCKQIGYNGESAAFSGSYFGEGVGRILLSELRCEGTETSLLSCLPMANTIGSTNCSHNSESGVSCSSACFTGDVRLVGRESTISQGRVEVCYNNTWETVCGDSWNINDAIVLCRQVGYTGIPTLYSSDYFGPGSDGLMLSRFGCIGSENSLSSCTFSFALDNCSNVNVVGVSCSSNYCNTGDIRLAGNGSNATQGRVEVCYNNTWGTVCGDLWGANDAAIVCKQLGYNVGQPSNGGVVFGLGIGAILFRGVACTGTESSLLLCPRGNAVIGATGCSHSQDVAVMCSSAQPLTTSSNSIGIAVGVGVFAAVVFVIIIVTSALLCARHVKKTRSSNIINETIVLPNKGVDMSTFFNEHTDVQESCEMKINDTNADNCDLDCTEKEQDKQTYL